MSEVPADHGLQVREPGTSVPRAVLEAAARAGRNGQPTDPALLRRVIDGLQQLPEHPTTGKRSTVVRG